MPRSPFSPAARRFYTTHARHAGCEGARSGLAQRPLAAGRSRRVARCLSRLRGASACACHLQPLRMAGHPAARIPDSCGNRLRTLGFLRASMSSSTEDPPPRRTRSRSARSSAPRRVLVPSRLLVRPARTHARPRSVSLPGRNPEWAPCAHGGDTVGLLPSSSSVLRVSEWCSGPLNLKSRL